MKRMNKNRRSNWKELINRYFWEWNCAVSALFAHETNGLDLCITLGDLRPLRLIMTEEKKEIHWGASAGRSCSSKWAISGPSSGMPSTNISSTALRLAANAVATSCHTPPPCKGESRRMQVLNRWVRPLLWPQRWIERGWAHQHMSMRAATHRVNLPATQSFMEPKALPQWGGRALGQRLLLVDVLDCSFICEPQLAAAALPRNWRSQRLRKPSHRMWCPSGSIWHPKMCRTNAISARPCVPGGGASVMLGLSSIVSVFTVEVIHWQSDYHSEMDAMEGSIMPSGVLQQWMLIRVLPCRIIPGSLPVSIWPHSGWTFTQSAWTPISGSVLGNPAVPRLCLSRTCWPHKLLCSFKFGRQQIFLRQEMNFLLLVLNYPIVGASLAVAVLSWPCQCPCSPISHHHLTVPRLSFVTSLPLAWQAPGLRSGQLVLVGQRVFQA